MNTSVSTGSDAVAATCFGMAPIPLESLRADAADISASLKLIESTSLPGREHDISVLLGAALSISAVTRRDHATWYTASEMFGHPAPELCFRLSSHLHAFAKCIRQQKAGRFAELVKRFDEDRGLEIFDSFLDVANLGLPVVEEEGVAFILKRPGELNLHIGVCDSTLRTYVAALMKAQGLSLKGVEVLAAWLVDDVEETRTLIRETFRMEAIKEDVYFVTQKRAADTVEALLKSSGNYVLSPWHIDA
jgi:hypothetical protein